MDGKRVIGEIGIGRGASIGSAGRFSFTFSFKRASLTGFWGVGFGAGTTDRESLESAIVKARSGFERCRLALGFETGGRGSEGR
jgi:hypothetical protein